MNVKRLIAILCLVMLAGCDSSTTLSPMPDVASQPPSNESPQPSDESQQPSSESQQPASESPQPSSESPPSIQDTQVTNGEAQSEAATPQTTELYRGIENPKKVDWKGYVCSAETKDGHLTRIYILYPDDFLGVDAVRRKSGDLQRKLKMLDKMDVIKSKDRELSYEWHSAYYLAYEFPPAEDFPLASFTNSNGKERTFSAVLPEKGERPSREELSRIRKSRSSEPPRKIKK